MFAFSGVQRVICYEIIYRFNSNVKIIQIDICPEEFHSNKNISVALCGDVKEIMQQINTELKRLPISISLDSEW
jgi:2-hydroxyacyl-CoA lyase 1